LGVVNRGKRYIQPAGQDSHNRETLAIHSDLAPHNGGISVETAVPQIVADEDDVLAACAPLVRAKIASQRRLDSEREKKPRREQYTVYALRLTCSCKSGVQSPMNEAEMLKQARVALPREVNRQRDGSSAKLVSGPANHINSVCMREGKRAQEYCIDDRENRRVRAYMPSARVRTATAVKPGLLRSMRAP
jgi:hypothetical protein